MSVHLGKFIAIVNPFLIHRMLKLALYVFKVSVYLSHEIF